MNNFFINNVARTFTNIEKDIEAYTEKNGDQNFKSTLKELEYVRIAWKTDLIQEAEQGFSKLAHLFQGIKEDVRRKLKITRKSILSPRFPGRDGSIINGETMFAAALTQHLTRVEHRDEFPRSEELNDNNHLENS